MQSDLTALIVCSNKHHDTATPQHRNTATPQHAHSENQTPLLVYSTLSTRAGPRHKQTKWPLRAPDPKKFKFSKPYFKYESYKI